MVDMNENDDPSRHFMNELSGLTPEKDDEVIRRSLRLYYVVEEFKTTESFEYRLNDFIEANMCVINQQVKHFLRKPKPNDDETTVESIYSGMAGVALLFNFYANKTNNRNKSREKAKEIIEKCISVVNENSDCITYIKGKSGIYVTATEIYKDMGDVANARKMIKKVLDLLPLALDEKMPDILFYGRAGYLYSLLLLKKIGWEDPDRDKIIRQVVSSILASGVHTCAKDKPKKTPIMFRFYNKKFLGASKGLSGVLHCLLLAKNYMTKRELDEFVKPALDYLLTLTYKSGNLPSSLCNDPDILIQWCHGAPGVSHTYALAFKIFKDEKYLNAAEQFADIVWKRGLLVKGHGLCHGVCGNTYTFMSLYQSTGKGKYLYRTARFVDWCLKTNRQTPVPDNPFSLYEGMAGVTYTLIDIQDPVRANIPGF